MIRLILFLIVFSIGNVFAQYNGFTTEYKFINHNVLVNLENYNEHHLRQDLADSVFYSYMRGANPEIIELRDFVVDGRLTVTKFSDTTTVLFYRCVKFTPTLRRKLKR